MRSESSSSPPAPIASPLVDSLDWQKSGGLIPAIVQDASTHRVLMLGYMNAEALAQTLASRQVTFWSRSKQRLWTKGETTGHILELVGVESDCDADTLLVQAHPHGPTCHLERESCFPTAPGVDAKAWMPQAGIEFLAELDALIARRERERPSGSYTTRLFEAGTRRIAQKVGEEGVETCLAAVVQDDAALLGESADLIYHLIVLLRARGLSLTEVVGVLKERHAPG